VAHKESYRVGMWNVESATSAAVKEVRKVKQN